MAVSNVPPAPMVSSMAEQISRQASDMRVIPPEGLPHWLPGLSAPAGWTRPHVELTFGTPARILTRSAEERFDGWIGCDVINLFRFGGTVREDLAEGCADRTLRDLGVDAPITYRVTVPTELGIMATRSRGTTSLGTRIWVQVTNYVVTTAGETGLIEHTTLIKDRERERLRPDVTRLSESVRVALIDNIRGQDPHDTDCTRDAMPVRTQ